MDNLLKLTLGDWSKDYHRQSEEFFLISNYGVHEVRQAYKDSCKKTGLTFDYAANYMEKETWRLLFTGYWDIVISSEAFGVLKEYGLLDENFSAGNLVDCAFVADLIMRFISLSMSEDFHYEFVEAAEIKNAIPINGYWNGELDAMFGYGLF